MRRGFTTFLLMLCMFWQALAHAGVAVTLAGDEGRSHALMHFEGQAHHHHDDGGTDAVHEDQSLASAQHMASDCGLHATAMMGFFGLTLPRLLPEMPATAAAAPAPQPCLAGPERPPKTLS
ncbi:hypothetical protein ASD88_22135 [Pelomonas sp. Root662]|nr:hypothetical protein ASC81_20555 [Pelomonas sp. Root405]KRA68130.1 hypothetical protein ASD88_22135 [Pelomonas sp. Root662]